MSHILSREARHSTHSRLLKSLSLVMLQGSLRIAVDLRFVVLRINIIAMTTEMNVILIVPKTYSSSPKNYTLV